VAAINAAMESESPDLLENPSYEDFARYFSTGILDGIPTCWDFITPFRGDITTMDTESWNFLSDLARVNFISEQQALDYDSFQNRDDNELSTSVLSVLPQVLSQNVRDSGKRKDSYCRYRAFSLSRETAFGRLDIIARTKSPGPDLVASPTRKLGCDEIEYLLDAKAILTPFKSSSPIPQMLFSISEQPVNGFNRLSMPTLSFRPSRPDDSPVFELAKYGSPHDLVLMIENGYASLNDCNTKGRSLLNVKTTKLFWGTSLTSEQHALGTTNLPMCKYLIEKGAEVDSFELDRFGQLV
jgi:hypothetical protein